MQARATYYDGQSSTRHDVVLILQGELLIIEGEGFRLEHPLTSVKLEAPIGNLARPLRLADGGNCQLNDNAFISELEALLGSGFQNLVHRLENSLKYALLALVATLLLIVGFIQYGIPALAKVAAFALPIETESLIGGESMKLLERFYFEESQLPQARQLQLKDTFNSVVGDVDPTSHYTLLFRFSKQLGANALALPGNTIVVTDGLVDLIEDDREFATVMAHEIGHLQQRHALRQVLQSMGTGLVVVAITGDITSITSVAAALPTALVEAGFSRDMEREADDAAAIWLKRNGLPVSLFAGFLQRLEDNHIRKHPELKTDDQQGVGDYFSTHPATQERIARLQAQEDATL